MLGVDEGEEGVLFLAFWPPRPPVRYKALPAATSPFAVGACLPHLLPAPRARQQKEGKTTPRWGDSRKGSKQDHDMDAPWFLSNPGIQTFLGQVSVYGKLLNTAELCICLGFRNGSERGFRTDSHVGTQAC